jgi:hypothetical protein
MKVPSKHFAISCASVAALVASATASAGIADIRLPTDAEVRAMDVPAFNAFYHSVTSANDPDALARAYEYINIDGFATSLAFKACMQRERPRVFSCLQEGLANNRKTQNANDRLGFHLSAAFNPIRFARNPDEAADALLAKLEELKTRDPEAYKFERDKQRKIGLDTDAGKAGRLLRIAFSTWSISACAMSAMSIDGGKPATIYGRPIARGVEGVNACAAFLLWEAAKTALIAQRTKGDGGKYPGSMLDYVINGTADASALFQLKPHGRDFMR